MEPVFPRLEMTAGPDEGLLIGVKEGEQTFGRVNGVEIYLSDTSVSRRHAVIKKNGDSITVRDLGSRNGTLLNGRKLNPGTEYPLDHLAHIQVGIYEWRFLLRALTPDEIKPKATVPNAVGVSSELEEPSQITHNDKLESELQKTTSTPLGEAQDELAESEPEESFEDVPKNEDQEAIQKEDNHLDSDKPSDSPSSALIEAPETGLMISKKRQLKPWIILGVIALLLIGVGLYFRESLNRKLIDLGVFKSDSIEGQATDEVLDDLSKPLQKITDIQKLPDTPESPVFSEIKPIENNVKQEAVNEVKAKDIFLDLKSEPIPARITFKDRTLGYTPTKAPISVNMGEEYEVLAEFDLRDIRDRYQMKYSFKPAMGNDVESHTFVAPIGVIKIQKLPRNVDFYLEGFYAYDKTKSNPVRLNDINYGKPVYVPYGHYVIELREKVKMGDADTMVTEIRYHREFDLDEKRASIDLSINDKDLEFFPAKIQTVPSGALVFVDEKEVGKTPYDGNLPLGTHSLRLARDGFFDYKTNLDMRTNTPYEATIKLETSKVGQYINRAKEQRRIGQTQQALNELVEALKLNATVAEKGEIYSLLGELSIDSKDFSQASTYFNLAKDSPDFKYRGILGLAKVAFYQGKTSDSLQLIVEVLINLPEKDPVVKEAKSLFVQLSSLKSVIYILTDPPGAMVTVNGQLASQKTPLILTDLGLGVYRLEIQKNGFKTQQVKKSLKLSEFVPVILKLEPEQF